MNNKDYYNILGIEKSASADEIKKAYRKLAMKYHPDKNADDKQAEEKFKEVSEAYAVLSDPEKKRMFDQFGSSGFDPSQAGGFHGHPFEGFEGFGPGGFSGGFSTNSARDIFSEVFGDLGDLFGGGPRRKGPTKGADLKYQLDITFEQAALGAEKLITFVRRNGPNNENAKLSVSIPAGVKEGQRLKLRNEGDRHTAGGPPGDLYVVVHISKHPLFFRSDMDVHMELPISFVDAIIGTEVEIPTLTGKAKITIPPGTHTGQTFRLKKKGFPDLKATTQGDMLIKVAIDVPQNLTKDQLELIKNLKPVAESAPKVRRYQERLNSVLKARA